MTHVDDGQCGLFAHFGETHDVGAQLSQIRKSHEGIGGGMRSSKARLVALNGDD